jgi:hypothetical protein
MKGERWGMGLLHKAFREEGQREYLMDYRFVATFQWVGFGCLSKNQPNSLSFIIQLIKN